MQASPSFFNRDRFIIRFGFCKGFVCHKEGGFAVAAVALEWMRILTVLWQLLLGYIDLGCSFANLRVVYWWKFIIFRMELIS